MRTILLFGLLFSLAACQQKKTEKKQTAGAPAVTDPKILVNCDGIGEVKLSDTQADLEKRFGKKAISVHENNVSGQYLSLWEGTPRQLNIYWEEKHAPFRKIRYIETGASDAPYMTADSLRVGLSLPDLVRRNGHMPLTFNNFYTEKESGLIVSLNNGDLQKSNPCFEGTLEWVSQSNIYKKDFDEFKKRDVVESSDNIVKRMEVMLGSFRVSAKK
ncbi:hypothetical protein [Arcticibacter sp. MXS-1]|uniref:hypothetical protein n=1 Tax=Arcticibacter sp. MXS-1 TaxID=3341726 RepID=UPI0035A8FA21